MRRIDVAQARQEEIKAWLLWKMYASQQKLIEELHVRIESGDRFLGNRLMSWKINWEEKIKQQIDPDFSVTKTDVQLSVSEEGVSKTSILNPHAPGFQTKTCSVSTSGGEAGWGTLHCACVLLP